MSRSGVFLPPPHWVARCRNLWEGHGPGQVSLIVNSIRIVHRWAVVRWHMQSAFHLPKMPPCSLYLLMFPLQVSAPLTGCKCLQSREHRGFLARSPVSDHKGETGSWAKGLMPKYHNLPSNKWGQDAGISSTPYLAHTWKHVHMCTSFTPFFF